MCGVRLGLTRVGVYLRIVLHRRGGDEPEGWARDGELARSVRLHLLNTDLSRYTKPVLYTTITYSVGPTELSLLFLPGESVAGVSVISPGCSRERVTAVPMPRTTIPLSPSRSKFCL